MSRRPQQSFRCEPLAELTRQLLMAPPERRAEQVPRIEQLHDEIDQSASYPLDYLAYRITRFRREGDASLVLVGEAVLPDLRLMIDALSRSIDLPIDSAPGTLTVEDLATKLNVSTKTITRWRQAGLRWRWVVPTLGGRKTVALTPQAVERFSAVNKERVEKASQFSQMTPDDRRKLIDRARRIATGRDVSLNQVAAHLSRRTGRALETIRQLLEAHDRDNPQRRIFQDDGPISPQQKRLIARAYRMGVSVGKMSQRFGRSRATIYRVINEKRAATARRLPLHYVESPTFGRPDADEVILRGDLEPYPANRPRHVSAVPVDDLPQPLRPLYRQPMIDDVRQRSLFVRFNYLKFKAAMIRDGLDRYEPRAADLDAFEKCIKQARQIRDLLVKANLPTVLSVAKRQLIGSPERTTNRLLQLLELGVPVLIAAVDEYQASRSQTFSSFLTNRLMQHFVAVQVNGGRAHRRLSAEQLLRRMVDQANESGVVLSLDETRLGDPALPADDSGAPAS